MVSLIEKPGQDLKMSLESVMKCIIDPAWNFPRRSLPRLHHGIWGGSMSSQTKARASQSVFTWVPRPVPPWSKCILESAPVGLLKCCIWLIHEKITFTYLPNEEEHKDWCVFPTNNKHVIGFVGRHVAKASKIPKGDLTHCSAAFRLSDLPLSESRCEDIQTLCRCNCILSWHEGAEDDGKEGACKMAQLPAQFKNI